MNIAATTDQLPTEILPADRLLTAAEFQKLADVPPEVEWFASISNAHTRRSYENAVKDFMRFAGIFRPEEFRSVTRAHLIAWRDELRRRGLGGATIRHRLASLASLFEYLCEKNAVTTYPLLCRCATEPIRRPASRRAFTPRESSVSSMFLKVGISACSQICAP